MMTRKHFQAIADILHGFTEERPENEGLLGDEMVYEITLAMANFCQGENPNFDRERFLKACGVKS